MMLTEPLRGRRMGFMVRFKASLLCKTFRYRWLQIWPHGRVWRSWSMKGGWRGKRLGCGCGWRSHCCISDGLELVRSQFK